MAAREIPTLYIVSDGRGGTCEHLVQAILVQFEGQEYRLVRKAPVRTAAQIRKIVKEASTKRSIIFYTLVSASTRQAMQESCQEAAVRRVDLFGTPLLTLRELFKKKPRSKPGLIYESDRARAKRLDAIEYTLKHDDGRRPHELDDSDVVLVGVSRASKSSTCFFLAYAGVRAANVPLIPGIEPVQELLDLDPIKVVGLTLNAQRLRSVRQVRVEGMHAGAMEQYLDKRLIAKEVLEARRMMDRYGWRKIDISAMAVEEIAKLVIEMRQLEVEPLG
jgi:regulator of PEP synthase PpsR (kinase-PPPase family)